MTAVSKSFDDTTWINWGLSRQQMFDLTDATENMMAIEIEMESTAHDSSVAHDIMVGTPCAAWNVKSEGSLRGNGFELISREPLPHRQLMMSLGQVYPLLDYAQDTFRAAVHVHINVQNFTRVQYARLLAAYYLEEPALYRWVGGGRDESVFAVPWAKGHDHVHRILSAYVEKDPHEWASAIAEAPKYAGLNLQATNKFGTVEFRHLQTPATGGTQAIRRIADYATRCVKVVNWARMYQAPTLTEYANTLMACMHTISPEHLCNVYSLLSMEKPIDRLACGIPTPAVKGVVDTSDLRRMQRLRSRGVVPRGDVVPAPRRASRPRRASVQVELETPVDIDRITFEEFSESIRTIRERDPITDDTWWTVNFQSTEVEPSEGEE